MQDIVSGLGERFRGGADADPASDEDSDGSASVVSSLHWHSDSDSTDSGEEAGNGEAGAPDGGAALGHQVDAFFAAVYGGHAGGDEVMQDAQAGAQPVPAPPVAAGAAGARAEAAQDADTWSWENLQRPVFDGCKWSNMEAAFTFLSLKDKHNVHDDGFNEMMKTVKEILPDDNIFPG